VVLTIRSFPIRVPGNSGELLNEIDWDTISIESGAAQSLFEITSVTKRVRRVGRFDANIVKQAIETNKPTRICLNHLDYVDAQGSRNALSIKMLEYIYNIEKCINRKIDLIGTGPDDCIKKDSSLKAVAF
jgi:adenylosuccinate synthase